MPMSSTELPATSVLYQDPWMVAVVKPAGVPVQPDDTKDRDLLRLTRDLLHDQAIDLVHRIDRPVSGVVLFARDAEALSLLHAMFRDRKVHKSYWAIVEGVVEESEAVLEDLLQHDTRAHRAVVGKAPGAKQARTRVQVLARGDRYALIEARPEGGAFHQIRAQLGAWGHAIKGDVKYGARRGEKDRSIALHARSLRFTHPITDAPVLIEAPAPAEKLWAALAASIAG